MEECQHKWVEYYLDRWDVPLKAICELCDKQRWRVSLHMEWKDGKQPDDWLDPNYKEK